MRILFKNETIISKEKITKTDKYAKVHRIKLTDVLKTIMCLTIIICSFILLKRGEYDAIIYIGFAIWGLRDKYKRFNIVSKSGKLIYEFYDDFFGVKTKDIILKVDYEVIKKVITEQDVYYIILEKCGLFLDKDNFTIGEKDEILDFLKGKAITVN